MGNTHEGASPPATPPGAQRRTTYALVPDALRVKVGNFVAQKGSENAAAKELGIDRATVRGVCVGVRPVHWATILRLEVFFGLPPSDATRAFRAADHGEVI